MKTLKNTINSMKELIKDLEARENKTLGDYKVIEKWKNTLNELEQKLVDKAFILVDKIDKYYVTEETAYLLENKDYEMLYSAITLYAKQLSDFINDENNLDKGANELFGAIGKGVAEVVGWCLIILEELDNINKALKSFNKWDYYVEFVTTTFTPYLLTYVREKSQEVMQVGLSAVDITTLFLNELKTYVSNTYNEKFSDNGSN